MSSCLTCRHVINPDREMAQAENSNKCKCKCHPWNQQPSLPAWQIATWCVGDG